MLVALAGLVLHRLPKTGLKDTGTQHKIQYEAIGTGRAKSIQWGDYTDIQGAGELSSTRIPWLKTVPMATFATSEDPTSEDPTPDPPFLRVEAGSPGAKVGCLIVVDDVPVAAKKPQKDFVDCQGDLPDSGDSGDGSPPSAQPALFR